MNNQTTAQFKPQKDQCNEPKMENVLNRQFNEQSYRNVVVSDLTYVRVGKQWNYICVLVDLLTERLKATVQGNIKGQNL